MTLKKGEILNIETLKDELLNFSQ